MKLSTIRYAVFIIAVVSMAKVLCAWNDRGHMIAAMIAYAELRPEVRERIDSLLMDHPQRDLLAAKGPNDEHELRMWIFARAATWPDMIRAKDNPLSASEHKATWHYVNFPISFDGTSGKAVKERWQPGQEPENILQALEKVRVEAVALDVSADRRAIALSWIEHLVGDLHQPLHTTNLYSREFTDGDRGGNSFAVKRGQTPTSLHTYWDNILGSGIQWDSLRAQYDGLRADTAFSRNALTSPPSLIEPSTWAMDGVRLAKDAVYRDGKLTGALHESGRDYPKDTPTLPSDYEVQAKKIAAKQVVLAGYRLADVLNSTFKSVSTPVDHSKDSRRP